jgi:hypothetical protein
MTLFALLCFSLMVWALAPAFHTKARCHQCGKRKVPIIGPWFGARRRFCIYCRDCAPQYYDSNP